MRSFTMPVVSKTSSEKRSATSIVKPTTSLKLPAGVTAGLIAGSQLAPIMPVARTSRLTWPMFVSRSALNSVSTGVCAVALPGTSMESARSTGGENCTSAVALGVEREPIQQLVQVGLDGPQAQAPVGGVFDPQAKVEVGERHVDEVPRPRVGHRDLGHLQVKIRRPTAGDPLVLPLRAQRERKAIYRPYGLRRNAAAHTEADDRGESSADLHRLT